MAGLVVVAATWAFDAIHIHPQTCFLWGLQERFAKDVGYDRMKAFALEVLQSADPNGHMPPVSDELKQRYPFLAWHGGHHYICVIDEGLVGVTWGSALTGHWGFEVSLHGVLPAAVERGWTRRASDEIQFVSYAD